VFLSYASQDAEAAQKICEALRAAGIEVWFDQSELRGGDVWDCQIRERIHDCRLFIALISAHTEARDEGYFRREWKLAVDRTHDMLEKKPFLLPIAIDATPERGAAVPDKFHEVQWTRLPGGLAPPEFVARIKRLLLPESPAPAKLPGNAAFGSSPIPLATGRPSPPRRALHVAVALLVLAALCYLLIGKPWISKPSASLATSNRTLSPGATAAAFAPPPHSIAVLPFVNMSGDKEQEYFSEGLTEELLNSLARINELQVAARTSSFSFLGEHPDIATVAHKLNVGAVLEGSVRRSAHTVRVTTQLINGVTGFHLWSETYDRNVGDVLKLQTEIATAVAAALKVTLLGDQAAKIEVGGTHNPDAFDAYLRASKAYGLQQSARDNQAAIDGYAEAIRLDPGYALAYADRSNALAGYALYWATGPEVRDYLTKAQIDARKAIALAPDLALAHLALASTLARSLDFRGASEEYQRALALEPGNARVLAEYGGFAADMNKTDAALKALERAVVLDPLNPQYHVGLGDVYSAGHYTEARHAYEDAKALATNNALLRAQINTWIAFTYYFAGNLQEAQAACAISDEINKPICLAFVYDKLGRHADAETMLAKVRASSGDDGAVFYSMIYAQWGDAAQALHWLEVAMSRRDPYLKFVKAYKLFDPVRKEPRFQAIQRALKFPD
jgi:TolB-like protein